MENSVPKIKTGLIGLAMIGLLFTNINAQENSNNQEKYIPKYKEYCELFKIHKYSNKGEKYWDEEEYVVDPKILDEIIDSSKTIITKKDYKGQEVIDLITNLDRIIQKKQIDQNKDTESDYGWGRRYPYSDIILTRIAKENNLPLYKVLIPGDDRDILRWDPDGKHKINKPNAKVNKRDLDICYKEYHFQEFKENQEIKNNPHFNKKTLRTGYYLKNLKDKQLKGFIYSVEIPYIYHREKYILNIEKYYNKYIKELFPKNMVYLLKMEFLEEMTAYNYEWNVKHLAESEYTKEGRKEDAEKAKRCFKRLLKTSKEISKIKKISYEGVALSLEKLGKRKSKVKRYLRKNKKIIEKIDKWEEERRKKKQEIKIYYLNKYNN